MILDIITKDIHNHWIEQMLRLSLTGWSMLACVVVLQQVADLVRVFFGYLSWNVLACVVIVQQVPDLVRVFFGYFSTVLKCVRLCSGAATSGWLGSSFFLAILALLWSMLACVVMVQQAPDLVRVFFGYFGTVLKCVSLCGNGAVSG
jgi:hypothetical protein